MKNNVQDLTAKKEIMDSETMNKTFIVKLQYNQNLSLQGTVQWIEKGKIVNFRSMMEFLSLLTESMGCEELRSWEDNPNIFTIAKG